MATQAEPRMITSFAADGRNLQARTRRAVLFAVQTCRAQWATFDSSPRPHCYWS